VKKIVLAAAASVAALLAGPVLAQDVASGYIGAGYTKAELDDTFETEGWNLHGSVNFPMSGSLGVQVDAGYTSVDDADAESMFGQAHLYNRGENGSFGGFLAYADSEDVGMWAGGLEGQHYMDRVTVAGVIGFGKVDELDAEAFGAAGQARLFANDNLRFDVTLGLVETDGDDTTSVGVGGEWQLSGTPLSVFGSWDHSDSDIGDVASVTVGVRFNFGTGSLMERDRSGASRMGARGLFGTM